MPTLTCQYLNVNYKQVHVSSQWMWFRYIFDIFAIWTYGDDKLKDVMLYIKSIHSSFQITCNYFKECVQFLDVSVYVDNSGNITTDLYVKPTYTQQYLMATSCHPNYTKRSIPYSQALRILRIFSSKESAKIRCTELVDCLVKRGYIKRKTNKQIERAFTNLANLIICVAAYVGLKSVKPLVLLMSHLDHHKVVANHVVDYAYRWFAITMSVLPLTIRPLDVITTLIIIIIMVIFKYYFSGEHISLSIRKNNNGVNIELGKSNRLKVLCMMQINAWNKQTTCQ